MEINHCVITIKQTIFARGGRAADLARSGDATAQRLIKADAEQQRTLATVRQTLNQLKINFTEISATDFSAAEKKLINKADLVISVGGDGTALGTSHYITNGALLGVNSAPGDSIGHFCHANRSDFKTKFSQIISDHWKPSAIARLSVELEGKMLPELALNDVLIAHDCPAATTRYIIQRGAQQEEHRSSGIWVSAPAGSTAGIKSAGGKIMKLNSRRIQFYVRELYREPNREYAITRGFLEAGEILTVASKMQSAHLYIDGARTAYKFLFGVRVNLQVADCPLRLFL